MSSKRAVFGILSTFIACRIAYYYRDEIFMACQKIATKTVKRKKRTGRKSIGYDAIIGNTPLIKLAKLSSRLGCNIYTKVGIF